MSIVTLRRRSLRGRHRAAFAGGDLATRATDWVRRNTRFCCGLTTTQDDGPNRHTNADGDAELRSRLARALATSGFEDVLVTARETAKKVLTEKRQQLISRIREGDIKFVLALADDLDRDVSGVSRDLNLLFEADIIEFDTDDQRKISYLKHDTVVAEPIA
ncbi:HVO_A0114 family putative DNA-binding protein [Halosimplex salinum]